MKKLIIISAMVLGGLGIKTADAQIGIRIHLNLGSRPVYVPAPEPEVVNEPVYDDYYYLPEVEAYYSVGEHCYYYQDGNRWIAAAYLPGMYHNFDWRTARRFEIRTNRPYMNHEAYRGRFGGYNNRADFYARAFPGRDRNDRDQYRGREQYGNRDWNQPYRNDDRHDDRDRNNGYNQPEPNRNQGGYGQPNQGGYNRGGNNDQQNPGRNQGGYSQPSQGQNQGGYNQGGNQQQPSQGQGQQGGRGNGNGQNQGGGNNGQPANHGQDRGGNNGAEQHYAANKMGMIQDRGDFASRPVRP